MTTYLFAGGGTAGHVNPMLAMARFIRQSDPVSTIIMLGTAEGLESRLVPKAGFELITIAKVPFPRRINRAAFSFIPRWRRAVRDVKDVIRTHNVDVVIGVGGYASAPAYAAARALRIPLAIHEANARPGLANRLGARWTRFVGVAIAGTPLRHARHVGMPLRREFEHPVTSAQRMAARASFGLDRNRPTIVVTGGSLGAQRINVAVRDVAAELVAAGVQILHVTGRSRVIDPAVEMAVHHDAVGDIDGYVVEEYCDRMRDALACADLVISRAGASTVCEISALGIPAVFVPYAVGNGEQRFNAQPLVDAGAAVLVTDADFTSDWVSKHALELVLDHDKLVEMARVSASLGVRDGTHRMCALVEQARASAEHPLG